MVQIILHINRVKNLNWEIKYGSNWVSITDDLVKEVLDNKEKIKKIFSYTNCADELFIQTIAYNNGFKKNIYRTESGQTSNMRMVDWERGKNGNPYTFTIKDLEMIRTARGRFLFARKFSETVDKKIIQEVISGLIKTDD